MLCYPPSFQVLLILIGFFLSAYFVCPSNGFLLPTRTGIPKAKLCAVNKNLQILDTEATLSQSTFPISPVDLISRCQEVIAANLGTDDPASFLSPKFEFVGPFDGPIGRKQYADSTGPILKAIKESFPDVKTNYYNFHVDPFEPNRVWYTTRAVGTMTETLQLPDGGGNFEANGNEIIQAPQATSMTFDETGMVTELTAGFVIDRRFGNTKGLSAVYAVFHHVGLKLPFPEANPYKPSLRVRVFQNIMSLIDKGKGSEGDDDKPIYWWRAAEKERFYSKPKNKWAVPPVLKDIGF